MHGRAYMRITVIGLKPRQVDESNGDTFANELNKFYGRFEKFDLSAQQDVIRTTILADIDTCPEVLITEQDVRNSLLRTLPNKARGPNGISGRVLKECASELACVLRSIFQMSISTHCIPTLWKTSNITPIQKKPQPAVSNDYRQN